jgi:hypothetical protein
VPGVVVEWVCGGERAGRGRQRDSVGPVWNYYVQLLERPGALASDPILGIDV